MSRTCPEPIQIRLIFLDSDFADKPCTHTATSGRGQGASVVPAGVSLPSEGELQAVSSRALATRSLSAMRVAERPQRKRRRANADLSDENARASTGGRLVRPRLEQWNEFPSTRADWPLVRSTDAPATSLAPWVSQSALSLRPEQGLQSSAQPVESTTTVLLATNPRSGPVSGGIEIWLSVDGLPTTSTLYARFGTKVTVTVSPIFHQSPLANLHIRRFGV